MLTVGLYELKTKETPARGELKFYRRIGSTDIDAPIPSITLVLNGESEPTKFIYDKEFSKEVGHYAFVRSGDAVALTPFNPDAFDSSDSTSEQHSGVSGTDSSASDTASDTGGTEDIKADVEISDTESGGDNVQQ